MGKGRLDKALSNALPNLSRERIKSLLKDHHISIDGKIITSASSNKYEGLKVQIAIPAPVSAVAIAQNIPLNVVYEDEHLIIIDKAAGMVVHPAAGHHDGTLVNALLHHCAGQLSGIGGVERPGIVHRIDRYTSGLMVAAKTDIAHQGLSKLFAAHDINRQYLAIVAGHPHPSSGKIATQIGRSPHDRKKMAVAAQNHGKHAITHYHVDQYLDKAALVRCTLETGRTHQVRVHMSHLGHGLIGDSTYGNRQKHHKILPKWSKSGRQALHATILGFKHPITEKYLQYESNLPEDMQELLIILQI
ncbi:pseudouridine synthase [Sphingorhabdus lutea]|uniref:Pseudouridine synthase n=1 Tax=Sphingorhabdus lutea TaxID=1913578 RepID=A0A1L3JF07_9SPHN|nr:pseudouridine synthase [Sphingorhabdus lutea]